jgi:hypothetical protein
MFSVMMALPSARAWSKTAGSVAARIRVIDLVSRIDDERQMLYANVVVAMLSPVGRPESEMLGADAEVDDLLGASVGRQVEGFFFTQRAEHRKVKESERSTFPTARSTWSSRLIGIGLLLICTR